MRVARIWRKVWLAALRSRIDRAALRRATCAINDVRPVSEIAHVKATSLSHRNKLLKYGQPGCYRAKDELGMPAALNDSSEAEFIGVADSKNEVS